MFTTAAPTGFELFWQTYVLQYGAPVLQMLLWAVQIIVFIYAIVLLRRWVNHATGATAAAQAVKEAAPLPGVGQPEAVQPAEEPINVDEFVE